MVKMSSAIFLMMIFTGMDSGSESRVTVKSVFIYWYRLLRIFQNACIVPQSVDGGAGGSRLTAVRLTEFGPVGFLLFRVRILDEGRVHGVEIDGPEGLDFGGFFGTVYDIGVAGVTGGLELCGFGVGGLPTCCCCCGVHRTWRVVVRMVLSYLFVFCNDLLLVDPYRIILAIWFQLATYMPPGGLLGDAPDVPKS